MVQGMEHGTERKQWTSEGEGCELTPRSCEHAHQRGKLRRAPAMGDMKATASRSGDTPGLGSGLLLLHVGLPKKCEVARRVRTMLLS